MARKKKSRAEHWQGAIERRERSGLSAAEFCRREGITYGTYTWWKQELRRRKDKAARKASGPSLVPVRVVERSPSPSSPTVVEVALRGGQVVRIHADLDPEGLAKLVGALDGASC